MFVVDGGESLVRCSVQAVVVVLGTVFQSITEGGDLFLSGVGEDLLLLFCNQEVSDVSVGGELLGWVCRRVGASLGLARAGLMGHCI